MPTAWPRIYSKTILQSSLAKRLTELDRMEISKGAYNGDVNTNMHSFNRQEKFWTYALEFMPPVSGRKAKEICSKPFHIWPNGRWHWTGRKYPKKHSMEMSIRTRIHSTGKGSFGHMPWDLCFRFPGRRLRRFVVSLFISGQTVDGIGPDGNIQRAIPWRCPYEHAFIQSAREVSDIYPGIYASGFREEG